MSIRLTSLALASLALVLVAGCSSSSSGGGNESTASGGSGTTLRGAITGAKESGVLDLTVAASGTTAKSVTPLGDPATTTTVTGAITFSAGGGTITLTGTYDSATGAFTVSGAGYTLTGNLKDGLASGSYTGPKGAGQFTANATSGGAVTVYCGTFKTPQDNGNWNIACGADGKCSGSFYSNVKSSGGALSGTLAGSTLTLLDPGGKGAPITGALAGTTITGTCSADGTCTFTGSVEACSK